MSGTETPRNPFNITVNQPKGIFASNEMLNAAFQKREQERLAKLQAFLDDSAFMLTNSFQSKLKHLQSMRKIVQEVEKEFSSFVRAMLYAEETGNIGPALMIASPLTAHRILAEQGLTTPEQQAPFITVPPDWVAPDRRVQI